METQKVDKCFHRDHGLAKNYIKANYIKINDFSDPRVAINWFNQYIQKEI